MPRRLIACLITILISVFLCSAVLAQDGPPPPPPGVPGVPGDPDGPDGVPPVPPPPPPPPDDMMPPIMPPGTITPDVAPQPGTAPDAAPPGMAPPGMMPPGMAPSDGSPAPGTPVQAPDRSRQPRNDRVPGPPSAGQGGRAPAVPGSGANYGGSIVPDKIELPPMENLSTGESVVGSNWSAFRNNPARTGYTEETLHYPLKLAWKHVAAVSSAELGRSNPSTPAVSNGVVYFCAGRRLYAVNGETGSLKWVYPTQESLPATIKSSPLVGEDLVYFGAGDGRLYAVTKEAGTLAWSFITKGIMNSSPVLVDDVIYVGSGDNSLYALDARTGQMKWPGGFRTRDDVNSSPAVADGLVYFLSSDMVLYAAHTTTGAPKWLARVGSFSRVSSPVVAENTVYIAAGNVIQAYQSKSGNLKWGVPLRTDITTVPAVANGTIFFGARNGNLYALTTAGKLKWSAPVDLGAPIYGSPMVAGDTVIVGTDKGQVVALDVETGDIKWKYTIIPTETEQGKLKYVNIAASPVVSNGTLYILADDGALHAFRYDMPDNTPPHVSTVVPPRGQLMPGAPPIEIAAIISDPGSGINYDTVVLTLDDEVVEHKIIPERGIVWYRTPVTQPATPLSNGLHTATLSVSDWAGNKTETSWSFTVDNRLRRQPATTDGTGSTDSSGRRSRAINM